MQTRYVGRLALVGALALAGCSSGDGTTSSLSPTPTVSPSASPSPSPSPSAAAAVTRSPRASARPSPTPSPTRSPRAAPSPTRSRTPSPSPKPSPTRKAVTHALSAVSGNFFDPDQLSVRLGDRVRVRNDDVEDHDFAIRALGVTSRNMPPGTTFTTKPFDRTGTFTFVCEQHKALDMKGTVTVKP